MDYISGLFLVFAGAALGFYVGYLLLYRDRTHEEKRQRKIMRDNEDLSISLKLAHNSHEKLEKRFSRQTGQLNVLQQLCDDWSDTRQQSDQQRGELEEALRTKSERLDEIRAELLAERQSRVELEDQHHQLSQLHIAKVADVEENWRSKFVGSETAFTKANAILETTQSDNEHLRSRLAAAETQIAELLAERSTQETLLKTATNNASGLEQEYVSLETALADSSALLQSAKADHATVLSAHSAAQESIVKLTAENETLRAENDHLVQHAADLESLHPQMEALQSSLTANTSRLQEVVKQRDQAFDAESTAQSVIAGLQKRIDNQETTIHRLRGQYSHSIEELKIELDGRTKVTAQLEASLAELESFTDEQLNANEKTNAVVVQLTAQRDQFADQLKAAEAEMMELVASHQDKLDALVVQDDTLKTKYEAVCEESEMLAKQCEELTDVCNENAELVVKLQSERSRLSDQVKEVNETKRILVSDLAEVQQRLDIATSENDTLRFTKTRIAELETLLQTRTTNEGDLVDQLKRLRDQYAETKAANEALEAKLDQLETQASGQIVDLNRHGSEVDSLQAKLRASEETIRSLRKERAAVLARLANYRTVADPGATVISFTEAMEIRKKRETTYDNEYGGPVRTHATRGVVYTQAPKESDDLKRISGIAEVLEARLNDYGIYTFKQIMEWKPEAIEEFSHLLTFKDRIERDQWVAQAGFFYGERQKVGKSYAA
jgi:predicted flap endonuclease-1-like 5' DNA nuclease